MTRYSLLVVAMLALVAVAVAQASRTASTVTVTAGKPSEFKFRLSVKTVPHGVVTFKVTNSGGLPHDFKVCTKPTTKAADTCAGKGVVLISPGFSKSLKITFLKAGTYEYLCSVTGHATAGMKGLLKVT
jgi:uncharacterized cupredoxin-like copper-binding protein